MTTTTTVGAALLGSGTLTGIITWLAGRHQSDATTAVILGDAARSLVEPMKAEIERLEAQAARLTARVDVLLARVDELLAETEECHRDRDSDRLRLSVLESELARYKAGPPK